MANLRDLPPDLQQLQGRMITRIDELSTKMEDGTITPNQFERGMRRIIKESYPEALKRGKNDNDPLTQRETAVINRQIREQFEFLSNFVNDIKENDWLPRYRSRAQQYASATTRPYSLGDVIRQAGKVIPLPSMPAEGTICTSNCGCRWEIRVLDGNNNFDAFWRLGKNDNCQTCVQRARDWGPIRIREGVLL